MHEHDVVIIGAGPAGSTAGNLLAQAGHDVLIIDKEIFPRFHIGESLLPCGLPIYNRLGIDLDKGRFVFKAGAEFVDERTGQSATFDFSEGLPGGSPHAYQVERASFDHELLKCAERAGARTLLGHRVSDVRFDASGVSVVTDAGVSRARYCVDATGQDAFFGRRSRSIDPYPGFGKAAVFCHFTDVSREKQAEFFARGHIKVLMIEDGWAWLIPLYGDKLSCGVVTRRSGVTTALLDKFIAGSALIADITSGSARTDGRIIRNFSCQNRTPHGSRWVCIGDASCFLDPVFSSGVSLAVISGERMSGLLSPALRAGTEGDEALMQPIRAEMDIAYRSIGALVHSFYHTNIVHNLFFAEHPAPDMRQGIISVLAGDVWRTDNRFQNMLLRSTRRMHQEAEAEPAALAEPVEG